jgi:hypothetical protein
MDLSVADQPAASEPHLQRIARQNLEAAEVLIAQENGSREVALELLTASMVAVAAVGSGLSDVPNPEQLAVWVYSDARQFVRQLSMG